MAKREEKKEKNHVGIFLGSIPLLGDFFQEISKIEPFRERLEEVNKKVEDNIRKIGKKEWEFEANVSVKSILNDVKKDNSNITIGEDYFYGWKGNRLILAVKVPTEKMSFRLNDKNLLIKSKNFKKIVELPDYFNYLRKKQYKKGVLVLEMLK